MLRLSHIERAYRNKGGVYYVLRRINLKVAKGEFVTIMGPSGSG
ncbi:MAG: hypothetical protein U5J83_17670 [Bryobacterales bacterium]|nr:hypothetical protein [Bryobacterales bacterium]